MRNRRFTGFKKLVRLLGADYDIMAKAGPTVQSKFYFSALTILLIFVISFASIRYAVNLLFHAWFIEIALSLFLSSLFVCIYIFLLHTFAKKQLGKEAVKQTFRQSLFNPSNLVRTGFVAFMGFLVAKPIEIYVFQPWLDGDVSQYRQKLLADHQNEVDDLFASDIERATKRKAKLEQLSGSSILQMIDETERWDRKIDSLEAEKKEIVQAANQRITNSDFFVYRVKTVMVKYRLSYLVCAVVVFLFLLPGYLIYTLSEDDEYYGLKKRIDTSLVLRNYHIMTAFYRESFADRYGKHLEPYTVYEDPPFNTKRKALPAYASQGEFLKKFSS